MNERERAELEMIAKDVAQTWGRNLDMWLAEPSDSELIWFLRGWLTAALLYQRELTWHVERKIADEDVDAIKEIVEENFHHFYQGYD